MVLGLDGATFDLIIPWINEGKLPTLAKLMKEGAVADLKSTYPPLTPPSWTSMITGKKPSRHGLYDFVGLDKEFKQKLFLSHDRFGDDIFDLLSNEGLKSVALNIPFTFPPSEIHGVKVSGMLTPNSDVDFIQPASLKEDFLKRFPDYKFELDWSEYKGRRDDFFKDTFKLMDDRFAMITHFKESVEWDLFFAVITDTDRAQHFTWNNDDLFSVYARVDEKIGKLIKKLPKDTHLFIVSDHGAAEVKKIFNANCFLREKGYLVEKKKRKAISFARKIIGERGFKVVAKLYKKMKFGSSTNKKFESSLINYATEIDMKKTKALALGFGVVYVNEQLEFDKKEFIAALKNDLLNFEDSGKKVIETVVTDEDYLQSDVEHFGPKLAFVPVNGYGRDCSLGKKAIISEDSEGAGTHAMNGIFIAHGLKVKKGKLKKTLHVEDLGPTILGLLGVPIPTFLDGACLKSLFKANTMDIKAAEESSKEERLIKDALKDVSL